MSGQIAGQPTQPSMGWPRRWCHGRDCEPDALTRSLVRLIALPPPDGIRHTEYFELLRVSTASVYATYAPSGDQLGEPWSRSSLLVNVCVVRRTASVPSGLIVQTAPSLNAIRLPPGDQTADQTCPSENLLKLNMCSSSYLYSDGPLFAGRHRRQFLHGHRRYRTSASPSWWAASAL